MLVQTQVLHFQPYCVIQITTELHVFNSINVYIYLQTPSTKSSPKSTRSEDSTELAVSNAKRRKSDGEVGGPVKIKPPNATPSSHSTSSSPLISRKSDPGGPKREPSPTPSSGDSEASSSISVENSTPKTNEPTYRIGEKVRVWICILLDTWSILCFVV